MGPGTAYGAHDTKPQGAAAGTPAPERAWSLPAPLLDSLIALAMLAFALALWAGAEGFAPGPWRAQGPGTFPRGIALLLGSCSLLLFGRALRAWRGAQRLSVKRPHAVAAAMALALVYPPLIEGLGYYGATAVWLPVLLWVAGCRRLKVLVPASLGFLVFSRIVFQQLLGTPMP